jgi:IS30 family transposase
LNQPVHASRRPDIGYSTGWRCQLAADPAGNKTESSASITANFFGLRIRSQVEPREAHNRHATRRTGHHWRNPYRQIDLQSCEWRSIAAPCAVPGHWEGDLLTGANDTHIATLVERNTRFTMLIKIPRKDTTTVVAALAKHISKLPEELRRSLTWDQGKEMHAHKRFTVVTNVQVYFCDPRSPWQRGSNENTNGLLRQYFPRGTNFSRISQSYLNAIALRLNQRPRKTLGFQTPADRLQAVLH